MAIRVIRTGTIGATIALLGACDGATADATDSAEGVDGSMESTAAPADDASADGAQSSPSPSTEKVAEPADDGATKSFAGEVSMQGGPEVGQFMEVVRDAAGEEIELDIELSYGYTPGSTDLMDACGERYNVIVDGGQVGINGVENAMVIFSDGYSWDYDADDIGKTVRCDETVTFDFPGFGPNPVGQGSGFGYYPIEGTFEVTERKAGSRTRYILVQS